MRRLALALAAALLLAACGGSGKPHLWITPAHGRTFTACGSADCGHYAVTLAWSNLNFPSTAGYYALLAAGTTSAILSTGGPITSLSVNSLASAVPPGHVVIVSGTNVQDFTTTGANVGATTIPVSSQTPNFAYPSGSAVFAQVGTATASPFAFYGLDCGNTYTLGVQAHDGASGTSSVYTASYTTPACSAVLAPTNTALPALSGTPTATVDGQSGSSLSTTTGSWANSPTSYSYQWYDCDAVGNNCSAISGATSSSYSPVSTDLGYTEYVAVTATNAIGSNTVDSGMSPAIGVPSWSPPSTANIWVNATAGICARNSTPAAYNASTACGTIHAAYAIASCGDTIEIENGTYNEQDTISNRSALDSCTSPVYIEAATGGRPVFSNIDSEYTGAGASNFIIQHINLDQAASGCVAAGSNTDCDIINLAGGKNVVIDDVTNGTVSIFGEKHVLVSNSAFGPCYTGTIVSGGCTNNTKIDTGTGSTATTDITYRNDSFTHFLDNGSTHFECMFLRGGNEIMVDGNHFNNCQLHAIFIQPTDGSLSQTTIQNNWFDEIENTVAAPPYYDTSYVAGDTVANGIEFGGNSTTEGTGEAGITIRFNSMNNYTGITYTGSATIAGPNYVYGNIDGVNASCLTNTTYDYNMFLTGQTTCGAHDSTVASLPLVSQTYGAEDFHLTCSSSAKGFVTPTTSPYLLAYDKDLAWRATASGTQEQPSGPREAGSESDSSCGT